MSRFTMTLAAASASAVAAIAAVALPAVGADSKTPRKQAKTDGDFGAFVACLRGHGLADAPTDPVELKPWLGAREASDPDSVKAADGGMRRQAAGREARRRRRGPTSRTSDRLRPRPRPRRAHRAGRVQALAGRELGRTPDALDAVMRACKMRLAPGPSEGPGKPGGAATTCGPPTAAPSRTPPTQARPKPASSPAPAPARQRRSPGPRRSARGARPRARGRARPRSTRACASGDSAPWSTRR